MNKKVIIVGGVAGGATTAARLRRLDENAEIILFERGKYISYANCGLPYHVGDVIPSREDLLLQTPESLKSKFNIDVRIQQEVTFIDRSKKTVSVKNLATSQESVESYDTLVLATGSSPIIPNIPGIRSKYIFSLWTVDDADHIRQYIRQNKISDAIIIGGGFIGIEMTENLRRLGITVSLVEMLNQVMAPFDFEMAQLIHKTLEENGVSLYLGNGVTSFTETDESILVNLSDGKQLATRLVILSIGVKPNSELARSAGLALNARGGIVVDKTLRTSDPDIFAVGDVIEVEDFISKGKTMIPLAGPANKQGRIAAGNIAGENDQYPGTQGSAIVKIFDVCAANTGANEKTLLKMA